MKYFLFTFLASCLLTAVLVGAPVDLTPPKNAVGSADRDGYLRYVHRFGDIFFSDNFSVPLRFDFSSRRVVDGKKSDFGWDGWQCGAIESTASLLRDGKLLEVQLLCAKTMRLQQTETPGIYLTVDGEWTGTVDGEQTAIERADGWKLSFAGGRVIGLRTDKGKEIDWVRDEEGRLIAIHEQGTEAPQLTVTWGEDGRPDQITVEREAYRIRFANDTLSAIEWTLSSGQEQTFSIVQARSSIRLQTSKLNRFYFAWNPETGTVLSDGLNKYKLVSTRIPGNENARRRLLMTTPDGAVISHELGADSGNVNFRDADGREIVVTKVRSTNSSSGAVDKVELLEEDNDPVLLMRNKFDENGKIVERIWLGNPVQNTGYAGGKIEKALLPSRDTVYDLDDMPDETSIHLIHFTYTGDGQLQSVRVNEKEVLAFAFDDELRVSRMDYPSRFEKTFTYHEDGSRTEAIVLPETKLGHFWYLEAEGDGVGPDLVVAKTLDQDNRLLGQTYADGRKLVVEYDGQMRRIGDLITAPDGETKIERITYVHSPQEGTALRIRENLITGHTDYSDIGIYGIGKKVKGRPIPKEFALGSRIGNSQETN